MDRGIIFAISTLSALSMGAREMPQLIDLPNDTSHPQRDCERAIRRGDYHFIGVFSFKLIVPEVNDGNQWRKISKPLSVKAIRGTSDTNRRGRSLNERAKPYAAAYNRVLVEWVETHHPDWLGPVHSNKE